MKYTETKCRERSKWYAALADYLHEGAAIIAQGKQPEMNKAQKMRVVKLVYISMQSAVGAGEWAFENVPGYAPNKTRAKDQLAQDIMTGRCGDDGIDEMCIDLYNGNRAAVNRWYN